MTILRTPISRESAATIREAGHQRQIIVTVEPPGLLKLRAKGCRKSYTLPLDACYMLAVKAHTLAEQRARRKK